MNRVGASKVALDEPSTSVPGVAASRLTQARPRQNLAAKLSLAKGATAQGVRSSSLGVAGEAEPTSSLSFSSEKERPRETGVLCGLGSQKISQLGGTCINIYLLFPEYFSVVELNLAFDRPLSGIFGRKGR